MYDITVVCTRHEELGRCNSNELYQIIVGINPEVIFEEMPLSYFDRYYIHKSKRNLESDTINRYLERYMLKQVPVDAENVPSESFFQDYRNLLKRIEGLADINGFNFRELIDRNKEYVYTHGFDYLNSFYNDNLHVELNDAIEKGLEKLGDDKLFHAYEFWKAFHDNRENEMLRNIYKYSKEHHYEKAIFFIGAYHRKSMMQKTEEYNRSEEIKLNWIFYGS